MMIRNLWCVGRNYADHAKELGNDLPKTPLIFLKAGTSTLTSGFPLEIPKWSKDVHHEVELAFQFGDGLKIERACVALDLTLRDVQTQLKQDRQPWSLAKTFKNSAPLGNFFDLDGIDLSHLSIRLFVNGELRQNCPTSNMIFSMPTLAEYVTERFPVSAGDLLFTGTPAGVAALKDGDEVLAEAFVSSDGNEEILSQGQWTVV